MAVQYLDDDGMVRDVMDRIVAGYFTDLATLDPPLNIDIRLAVADDPEEPAVKHRGHPCAATVELIRPKEKSRTGLDARITVDKRLWLDSDDEENAATIWHELRHLEPLYDKHGILRLDAYRRPKLKLRLDDWMLTGFRECVRIFGEKSREMQSLRRVREMLSQRDFDFVSAKPVPAADPKGVAKETFAALVSVGHTEQQARDAVNRALEGGRRFAGVNEMIECIYAGGEAARDAASPQPRA
jgi:hypothetical protein